jgi:hypothetical protein
MPTPPRQTGPSHRTNGQKGTTRPTGFRFTDWAMI